jgi:hypothetical protein
MPATRMTARANNSTRSGGSASYRASQSRPTPRFPARDAGCSRPTPATKPVSVIGVTSEEPAVTRVAAAGSVVSCEGVPSRADACCVAKCVARRWPRGGRFRARGHGRQAAAHDVFEVVLAGHEVVLGRDLRRVPEPRGDDVGRVLLHPVGLAGGTEVLQEPRPGLVPSLGDDPLEVRAEVHARPGGRPGGAAALCGCYGCASATTQGWSVGGQNPNLKTGVIHGGRSKPENSW